MGTPLHTTTPRYLTVTELNQMLNGALERAAPYVYFEGEISEAKRASSGHTYLTIKDAASQTNAVVWRGVGDTLDFQLVQGLSVVCEGKPNIWHVSGRLQIVVHKIQPAGEGLLRKRFLELKAKLEAEGVFQESRKRPLPFFPRGIGIVTSAKGAAIHDMMVKLRERMPHVPVYLRDVRVQGAGAAEEIADGIRDVGRSGLVDVMIVGRGGGSLEDLWSFNEEIVVRAIFASPVPVISAVGHEVDVTLSDLVADVRAPTPTAAAEMVVPRKDQLLEALLDYERRIFDLTRTLSPRAQSVDDLEIRFTNSIQASQKRWKMTLMTAEAHLRSLEPKRVVAMLRSREEHLRGTLSSAVLARVHTKRVQVDRIRLERVEIVLDRILRDGENRVYVGMRRLNERMSRTLRECRASLDSLHARLSALNPQRTLERGYAVVQYNGRAVLDPGGVPEGAQIAVTLARGKLEAEVRRKNIKE